jgi:DNA-binding transcriptional ArsR family regulator
MLGPRQREVLALLKEGLFPAEIARKLGITKGAVSHNLAKLEKAGYISRSEAGTIEVLKEPGEEVEEPQPEPVQTTKAPRGKPGAPAGNRNAMGSGEFSEFWRQVLTPDERRLLDSAERPPALELARQQVALCDILIRRLAERIRRLEALPFDLIVEGESNLVKHVPREEDGDTASRPMPAVTITRSTTVREVLLGLYKAQREFLKVRAGSISVLHQLEKATRPHAAPPQPGAKAEDFGEDLSQLSDDELAKRIRDLGSGLGGGDGGPTH